MSTTIANYTMICYTKRKKAAYESMKRIESTQNSLVKHWKKLVSTRKERDKSKEFIIEGFHLVEEALKNKSELLTIIIRDDIDMPAEWDISQVELVKVTTAVAKEIAETERSQGVFAHCRQREYSEEEQASWKKLLFVDAVQDPGNVGTMIRTADAAGIDAVILGKGTVDAFSPKTVRSGQGSHFHIPIISADLMDWVMRLKNEQYSIIGTGLTNATSYKEVSVQENFALIVGNEGSGVSDELLQTTDANVIIPLHGKAESLNVAVATGILLYAFI